MPPTMLISCPVTVVTLPHQAGSFPRRQLGGWRFVRASEVDVVALQPWRGCWPGVRETWCRRTDDWRRQQRRHRSDIRLIDASRLDFDWLGWRVDHGATADRRVDGAVTVGEAVDRGLHQVGTRNRKAVDVRSQLQRIVRQRRGHVRRDDKVERAQTVVLGGFVWLARCKFRQSWVRRRHRRSSSVARLAALDVVGASNSWPEGGSLGPV